MDEWALDLLQPLDPADIQRILDHYNEREEIELAGGPQMHGWVTHVRDRPREFFVNESALKRLSVQPSSDADQWKWMSVAEIYLAVRHPKKTLTAEQQRFKRRVQHAVRNQPMKRLLDNARRMA